MEAAPDKTITIEMGKGDSWAKDVRTGKQGVPLDEIEKLLAILGLKLVDSRRICITPEKLAEFQACETLALGRLAARQPTLDQRSFEQ